jgi:large subunit ribosomal protein L22
MEVVATAKDVRVTARKARVVAHAVVGLPVAEAKLLLQFTPRHAAHEIRKVIRSAEANAEHNYNLDPADLRVARIVVEQAGMIKRYIAKPRGQAGSIFKRMSHLRVYVTDEEPAPKTKRRSVVSMPSNVAPTTMGQSGTARRRRVKAEPELEAPVDETVETVEETTDEAAAVEEKPKTRRRAKPAEAATATDTTDEAAKQGDAGNADTEATDAVEETPEGDKK